jgi:hypothetical protein
LPLTIENRKGTVRSGVDKAGRPWSVVLPYQYGYIRRTLGADGDHVDCFIGPNPNSQFVVIVNQHDRQTGVFDEIKVGLGYVGLEQAKAAYRQGYRGGNVPRADFRPTTLQRLKEWLKLKQTWAKFDLAANMKTVDFGSALRERVSVKSTPNGMHRLKLNGRNIGHMTTQANGVIRNVAIDDKFKGLGLGKKLYGDVMRRMPNKTLVSGWATSDDAHRVWKGMAKRKGYSVSQVGNGPYVGKLAFSRPDDQLTLLANPMKRLVQFRQPTPKQEEDKPSVARKVAAAIGGGAAIAGFYKYASTRPDVKKRAYDLKRRQIAADPTRSARMANTAYVQGLKKQPSPRHTPAYDGGAGFDYGVKPVPAQPAAVKVRGGVLKSEVLNPSPMTPAERAAAKIKAGWTKVNQTTSLRARVLLTQFQERNRDGTLGVSTSPLTAYRKASRVVPWVGRASQTAGDLGDMATGKEVKDPFYKKTWFKRAATTAAIGLPLLAANLAHSGARKQADGVKPRTGNTLGDKVDRFTHTAANTKRKVYGKLGLSARIRNPILLQAVVTHLKNFDRIEKEPRRKWVAPVAVGLAGLAAAGGVGAHLGVKKLRASLQPSIDKLPGTLDAIRTASGQIAKTATGAASSVKAASDSFRGSVEKIGHVAGDVSSSKGKTWLRRRLGFSAALKPVLLQAVVTHLKNFDYTDRNDWDLRDARGKSARVFAPGSKPRDRREKNWNEKTENIRLVRNIAIAGTLAGAGAALHYRNKANKLVPQVPKASNVIDGVDFRKPKMASAKIRLTQFARKSGPALSNLIDATKRNISLPDRPELPGEGAVKFVYELPPKRRAGVLKVLGAGALAGSGVVGGALLKRPKTGAALGGLGAGLLLG